MRSKTVVLLLKGALAVAIVAGLVYFVDAEEMRRAAADANAWWIALAVALLPLNTLFDALLWKRLLRLFARDASLGRALQGVLAGYALATFTPARTGEYAGRVFSHRSADGWTVAAAVFVHRMVDLLVYVLAGLPALLWFVWTLRPEPATAWTAAALWGAGATVAVAALVLYPRPWLRWMRRFRRLRAVADRFVFLDRLGTRDLLRLLFLSVLRFLTIAAQFVALLLAFDADLNVLRAAAGVAMVYFAKNLIPPVTFLDLGIREGAAVLFLPPLGVAEAAALNASLLIFAINLLLAGLLGVPFVMKMRLRRTPPPESPGES